MKKVILYGLLIFTVIIYLLTLTGCPTHVDSQYGIKIASDGNGGAFSVYEDTLGGNICVQKISPDGNLMWGSNGVILGNSPSVVYEYSIIHIISIRNGVIVSWYSDKPQFSTRVFHVSKLNDDGHLLWQLDLQHGVDQLTGDGSGGAFLGYVLDNNLYINHIDTDGNILSHAGYLVASGNQGILSLGTWKMISDSSGGVIVVWKESEYPVGVEPGKATATDHLFAQKIGSDGSLLWGDKQDSGLSIYAFPEGTWIDALNLIADGKGGAILGWFQVTQVKSGNNGSPSQKWDYVMQRVDDNGHTLWQAGGIPLEISQNGGHPTPSEDTLLVSDNDDGAIVGWRDLRETTAGSAYCYAQRINAEGNKLWQPGGIKVASTSLNPRSQIVSDGSGGAIFAYGFQKDGKDLHLQKIDAKGNTIWSQNGVTVTDNGYAGFSLSPDGNNGAIIGWGTGGPHSEKAYIQRVSADGNLMWGPNGIRLNRKTG